MDMLAEGKWGKSNNHKHHLSAACQHIVYVIGIGLRAAKEEGKAAWHIRAEVLLPAYLERRLPPGIGSVKYYFMLAGLTLTIKPV